MVRYQATMVLSLFAAVMVAMATDTTPGIPSLYPPEDLGALGGTGAEPEGMPGFDTSTALAEVTSSTTAPPIPIATTTSSSVETPAPPATVTSTTAGTPAPPAPASTTATSTEPPAPEFLLGEVAIAISGLNFQYLTAPEQATLSRLYAEAIATTLNINPLWVRNMSEVAGRVSLGPGQVGNITNAGNFLTDVTARRLEWATQLNAFYQTPADVFEASKPKFNSADFLKQMTENTKTGLGADTLQDRDDVLKLPLSVVTAVKDLPMMKAWTTSTATTTNTGSTTSSVIPPLPTTTSSTVSPTTTTTAGAGSSFPWLWWLLGVLLCCLLAGGAFFAYRKFSSPPKKATRSVTPKIPESPAAEDFVPLVHKPADPPKPTEPPIISAPMAPTAPSYAPAPTVLTAPPVYMSAVPTTNVMPTQTAQPVRTVQRQAMPIQAVQAAPIATYTSAPVQAAPVPTYTSAPAINPIVAQAGALFDQLDANHDGVITRAEMAAALGS